MNWMEPLLHWLAVHTGTVNEGGPYYGFWSGFGSDLGEVAIIGGLVSVYRKHNCHDKGCWRIGKHLVDGTPRCSKHHLDARAALQQASVGEQVAKALDATHQALFRKLDQQDVLIAAVAAQPAAADQPQADAAAAERVVPPAAAPATTTSRKLRRPAEPKGM